ncbi:MAG: SAM-dependent methyltransferase [Bdellovibrionales bacterium GWA2_49_15]|nr:MAG: SAM-dependent methyltransferase [Bdellovibrionales bacterium GWA2_49_15]HAZ13260.1 SAM-dependent methyltransferase [Bdellovibrionales bacterium]
MGNTNHIVQKLWNLCDILRDGGVDYMGYVNELTFILFPKMLEEKDLDKKWLPNGYRWKDLTTKNGVDQFNFYREMLLELGKQKSTLKKHPRVIEIYSNANTALKQPKHLALIVSEIDKIDWYSHDRDDLGDMYEGLLEKVGTEKKSGAGQYFTPRPLIESIVELLQPQAGEEIQDPAAGTCGFLIYADKYIKKKTNSLAKLSEEKAEFQIKDAFYGVELVEITHRLALMNLMLHDMESTLIQGNSLGEAGASLKPADLILTNPPFGTAKGDGGSTRTDLTFGTSNKQLSFLQHIYRSLKVGGRAGVVLPDNVLFESGVGAKIRQDLMEKCNLHTILRLPTGIFYAQGVKTNVLFFTRGKKETGNTKETWFYDLRANMPSFGKTSPLKREHFKEFEKAYGKDPNGKSKRQDEGETGRYRCFSIDEIKKRDYNLDISWLRDESITHADDLPEPEDISTQIADSLKQSLALFNEIAQQLNPRN